MSNKVKIIITILITTALISLIVVFTNIYNKAVYPIRYSKYVEKYSKEYKIDPYLVYAIIKAESNFKQDATSNKGAKGLMQVTDSTGKWIAEKLKIDGFEINDLYDPEINIKIGCWYVDNLRTEFDGNTILAITAYNSGIGRVKQWLTDRNLSANGVHLDKIPFVETDSYVKRIIKSYNAYKKIYQEKK